MIETVGRVGKCVQYWTTCNVMVMRLENVCRLIDGVMIPWRRGTERARAYKWSRIEHQATSTHTHTQHTPVFNPVRKTIISTAVLHCGETPLGVWDRGWRDPHLRLPPPLFSHMDDWLLSSIKAVHGFTILDIYYYMTLRDDGNDNMATMGYMPLFMTNELHS